MLGFPILYLKGMGIMMFQLSGFCYRVYGFRALGFGFFFELLFMSAQSSRLTYGQKGFRFRIERSVS